MVTKHLDLGCGHAPRNPYRRDEMWGIDISKEVLQLGNNIKFSDLSVEKIPFEADYFDSVSAYDFLEHIPRVLASRGDHMRFPFIELMNEIWRVLKPGGLLYAVTPAYPRQEAFMDPTHVNIITEKTHTYFSGPDRMAKMYGFVGNFKVRRAEWILPKYYEREPDRPTLAHRFRKIRNHIKRRNTHFLWELEVIKP